MTIRQLFMIVVILALAPLVAVAAGIIQRRTQGIWRGLAEVTAVVALWQTFNASMLGLWGAGAQYVQLGELSEAVCLLFLVAQPIVPFFCYFQIVRPARSPQHASEPSERSKPVVF